MAGRGHEAGRDREAEHSREAGRGRVMGHDRVAGRDRVRKLPPHAARPPAQTRPSAHQGTRAVAICGALRAAHTVRPSGVASRTRSAVLRTHLLAHNAVPSLPRNLGQVPYSLRTY